MLPFMLPFMPGGAEPVGQQAWTTPGSYSFVVPDGVTRIWALVIGAGGSGASPNLSPTNNRMGAGAGGGLAFACLIVTPGETLTVIVGAGSASPSGTNFQGVDGGASQILRGVTPQIVGGGGQGGRVSEFGSPTWATGGAGFYRSTDIDLAQNKAQYDGGRGGYGDGAGRPGGGGGTAGYAGNGGDGAEYFGLDGYAAAASSGGGGGGGGGWGGGGVGLLGIGATGGSTPNYSNPGSGGTGSGNSANGGQYGAGAGPGGVSGGGAVRILWGPGRAYPSTNTGDV